MASKKVESCLSMMAQYYNMYIEDETWREKEDIYFLAEALPTIKKIAEERGVTESTILRQIEEVVNATHYKGTYKIFVYLIIDWLKTGNHVHIRNFLDRGASRRGKDLDEDLSEIKRFFETHPVPVR